MLQDLLSTERKTILVVEDDASIGDLIQLILSQEAHYNPLLLIKPDEALEIVKKVKPDLFIIDYRLMGINGIELYDRLHKMEGLESVPAIITSASIGTGEHKLEVELQKRNLVGLAKPFEIDDFLATIKRVGV